MAEQPRKPKKRTTDSFTSVKFPADPKENPSLKKDVKENTGAESPSDPTPQSLSSSVSASSSDELQKQIDPVKKIEDQFEDLNELEKRVITIAKDVLKKKRYEATITTQRPENMSPLVIQI